MAEIELIKWAVFAVFGGFTWFLKRTLDMAETRIKTLETELALVKNDYLHKNDFREFKTELRSMFEEIRTDIRELTHKQQ